MSLVAKRLHGLRFHLIKVGMEVGDFVLDRTQLPSPKRGRSRPPQFSAHAHCGQTAGWIKTALGTEVGLSPGHMVLHGDPAPLPKKGRSPIPNFGPFLLWPKGWMHQHDT